MFPVVPNSQHLNYSNITGSFSWTEKSRSLNYNATSEELVDKIYANTQNLPYHIGALFSETFPVRWIRNTMFPSKPQERINKVNILISKSLTSSIKYHSANKAIEYVTVKENNVSHELIYAEILKHPISLISNGTRNFDVNFIKSLPYSAIRTIYSHGNVNRNGHIINFLQDPPNQQTLDVLSLLKNKQEVLFLNSCHGGTIHHTLEDQLGNSILVTFSKPKLTSLTTRSDEIIDCIIKLANLQKNPKHIIVDIASQFPFDIGIKVPGQKSQIFFNQPDIGSIEIKSSLLSIIDYLKLDDYNLDNLDIDESLKRKKLFELFEYAQNYEELSSEEQALTLEKIRDKNANFLNSCILIDKNSLLHIALSNENLLFDGKYYESTHYFAINVLDHWIKVGANINMQRADGNSPLHLAMMHKDPICAKKLLTVDGVDIHLININTEESVLHIALAHQEPELISKLIALGANIHEPDGEGNTPLHLAMMRREDPTCAKKLIAAGADIHLINIKTEKSVLHLALAYQEPELISELIALGANIHAPDGKGDTPLHLALKSKTNYEFAQYFIDKGVNINAVNHIGLTPVLIACVNNHVDVTNRLIRLGADVHITFQGRTLLDFAQDPKTIKLLRDAGVRKSM